MKVLLVDAYDSFTHIIDQYLRTLGARTVVVRSRIAVPEQLAALRPDAVVLGPGPGHPAESGHVELVHAVRRPGAALGVCLGHQAIGLAYGGTVTRPAPDARQDERGRHDGRGVFAGPPAPLTVTRYHSLIVADPPPPALEITARRPTTAT